MAEGLDLGTLAISIAGDNSKWLRTFQTTTTQVGVLAASAPVIAMGVNTAPLATGLTTAQGMVSGFAVKAKAIIAGIFTGIALALATVGVFIVVRGFFKIIGMASDAEEAINKFNVTFGEVAIKANVVADAFAKDFGLASATARTLLGDTGDLLSGFGFAGDASLDLSIRVNELAVDLASFTNIEGGARQASRALTKALLGERESVKELGIAILEMDVKAQVAINSAKGLTFATERQAKAYATLDIAISQSQNAIGDYARTSDQLANTTRRIRERFLELAQLVGTFLIDVFDLDVKALSFEQFLKGLIDNWDEMRLKIFAWVVAIQKAWAFGAVFVNNMITGVKEIVDIFATMINWIGKNWKVLWENAGTIIDAFILDTTASFMNIVNIITGVFKNVLGIVSGVFIALFNIGGQLFEFLLDNWEKIGIAIVSVWDNALNVGKEWVKAMFGLFKGVGGALVDFLKNPLKGLDFSDMDLQGLTEGFAKAVSDAVSDPLGGVSFDASAIDVAAASAELDKAMLNLLEKPLGEGQLKVFIDNIMQALSDIGVDPPDFKDWGPEYKNLMDEWSRIDKAAAEQRAEWADTGVTERGKREQEKREEQFTRIAHAGALERGTQAAFKAQQRRGADPQEDIKKNTKATADSIEDQVVLQRRTLKAIEDQTVIADAAI